MRYELCLCDADGTLLDFAKGEESALCQTLAHFSLPSPKDDVALYSRINDGLWKRFEKGEITQPALRVQRFADFLTAKGYSHVDAVAMNLAYVGFLSQQHEPLPGALALLQAVSRQMPVILVTNGIAKVQRSRLSLSELSGYLSGVIISEELGVAKPDPEMLYAGMRLARISDKARVVMVGDSLTSDIRAAINAGIDSILFTNQKPAPIGHGATYTAQTLAQAAKLILA